MIMSVFGQVNKAVKNGLCQKKIQTERSQRVSWGHTLVCHFTNASHLQILQTYAKPLGSCKAKNQDPWKFQMIFSWLPLLGNFISFLIDPWNFHLLTLFSIPLEIPCPKPPVRIFSWINRIYLFWTHLTSKLGNAEGLEMSHCPTNNNALTFKDSTKFRSWKNTWETKEALPNIRPNANGLLLPLRSKKRS